MQVCGHLSSRDQNSLIECAASDLRFQYGSELSSGISELRALTLEASQLLVAIFGRVNLTFGGMMRRETG